ncbi:hypothetical protein [uncultured Microbulbifer sp.]|uniref:hypothetical protein n=1 Tax=uncultured Microbulbifer sp. TaxID=348147 RepID=UPI00263A139A|nr:hypothetical protein [uncultured Microbulbifer sp.]
MIFKNKFSFIISTALALTTSFVQALPDARQGNPLGALGIQTPDGVGDVVRDHELPNTLHVGPANVKEIKGIYSELDSSGPMCTDFVNIRKQAYLLPPDIQEAYNNKEYVSNYFQISIAIPWRSIGLIRQVEDARTKLRDLENDGNIKLKADYFTLRAEWIQLEADIAALEDEKDDLSDQNTLNISSCITSNSSNQTALVQCLTNNANWYTSESEKLDSQLETPVARKREIRQDYFSVKGLYEAYEAEESQFTNDLLFAQIIFDAQIQIARGAWDIEKDVVAAEEGKIVGRATAGYNLFDKETTLLSQILKENGQNDFEVKQLEVFNVNLNSGVTLDNVTISTDNGADLYRKNTWSFPADTLMRSSILKEWDMPFEREDRGDTIYFDTMDEDSFASGGVSFYVTKGARCGEYTQYIEETYTGTENGTEAEWVVQQRYYEPQPNRVIFSESIGLNYNYYAYPGPLRGQCSIDVDRMNSYWRNTGVRKGWSWFRTKTKSWDITKSTARENMGMQCTLDLKPTSNDPEEALELAEQFERHMYSDMWQMFLAVYAKEYKIEVSDPNVVDPGKSQVGNALGTGVMKLCGANVYCQFTGIVLKALDEIGGSKAKGTTSSESRVYGTIWKRYDKNTFTVKGGSSLVNLKVCVDQNQCD